MSLQIRGTLCMKEWDPRFSRDERDGAEGAGQQGHVLEDSQGRSNVSFL